MIAFDWVVVRGRAYLEAMTRATVHLPRSIASRCAAFALLAVLAFVVPARAAAPAHPDVVVELFTSQGCSSCPPADAYLAELAKRPGILALSMHIDYWNSLGWRDPYSSAAVTARQRAYARALGSRYVYTPEMVVAGRKDAVGSERGTVRKLIAAARAAARKEPRPKVSLSAAGAGRLRVTIGAAPFTGTATVWLVAFDDHHATRVGAGENRGRTLNYVNVVRSLRSVGTWAGRATEITLDLSDDIRKGYGNCAILVQAGGTGPILAAATMPMGASAR